MLRGAAGDDIYQHLMNFTSICKSQEIPRVNQATNELNEMPHDSIRT